MGHIELPLPTYHPLLMDHVYLLLRSQCAHCSRLRLSEPEKRAAAISLYLYKRGRWQEAEELASRLVECEAKAKDQKDMIKLKELNKKKSKSLAAAKEKRSAAAAAKKKKEEDEGLDFGSDSDSSSDSSSSSGEESGDTEESDPTTEEEEEEEEVASGVHEVLLEYEKALGFQTGGEADANLMSDKDKANSAAKVKNDPIPLLSSFERSLRHQYIKSLLDTTVHTKKCGQCSGFSPRYLSFLFLLIENTQTHTYIY
jgi:DNA-directed RNA polymerase beta' subunit